MTTTVWAAAPLAAAHAHPAPAAPLGRTDVSTADSTPTPPAPEEVSELVRRAQLEDPAAVEQLAGRALRLAGAAVRTVLSSREDGRDVAQETAIHAIRALSTLRDPGAFDAWVYRASIRRALKLARRERLRHPFGRPQHLSQDVADVTANPHLSAEQRALATAVMCALRRLPARQRAAVTLRYILGMSEPQVADALGCPAGTAASLLSRARQTLRTDPGLLGLLDDDEVGEP